MTSSNQPINNKFEYSAPKILTGVGIAVIGTGAFAASTFSLLAGIGALAPTLSAVTSAFITLVPAAIAILTTNPVGWTILSAVALLLTALTIFGGVFLATRKKEAASSESTTLSPSDQVVELPPCKNFAELGEWLNFYKDIESEYNSLVQDIKNKYYNTLNNKVLNVPKRGEASVEEELSKVISDLEKRTFEYPKGINPTDLDLVLFSIKFQ